MTASVEITLTVARVGFGGNTGNGQYFYSFSPDNIIAGKDESPLDIIYRFDKEVPAHFTIKNVLNSDGRGQITSTKVAKNGRHAKVVNKNDVQTLIFFSVLVYDEKRKVLFSCDPQVGNVPDPV